LASCSEAQTESPHAVNGNLRKKEVTDNQGLDFSPYRGIGTGVMFCCPAMG